MADAHALIGFMPVFIVAFVVGICGLQQMPDLPVMRTIVSICVIGAAACLAATFLATRAKSALVIRRQFQMMHMGALLAGGIALGFGWAAIGATARMAETLPTTYEGRDIVVTGVVAGLPEAGERSVRFDFDVDQADAPVPRRIRLSWYQKDEGAGEGSPVRAGERWRMVVRLKRPHGQVNPHGFDYEAYLLEKGIRAVGYVRPVASKRLDPAVDGWRYSIVQARQTIRERFLAALPGQPGVSSYAGVLVALAIGDQSSISSEQWQVFSRTGITHLMSISGLHVTMLAALVYAVSAMLWRALARRGGRGAVWLLNWPLPQVCSALGLSAAAAYCALAGFGLPAQRTLYMLATVTLAQWSRRNISYVPSLTLALWVVVLIDPWAVLSAGFWLSFVAVAILLWTAQAVAREPETSGLKALRMVQVWGRAQWGITVGTLPVLLALFGQFSLVSPVTNAIAIPLVSFVVTPLVLFAAVTGIDVALLPAHALTATMMRGLEIMATWPLAVWQQAQAPWWWVALALVGAGWLLFPRPVPWRWMAAFLFVPLLSWQPERPPSGEAWVRVLDVGQGLAVHVQTHSHDALFDTGPAYSSEADAGNRLLVPYLRAMGVRHLDTLFVSHGDSDHAGGALSVTRAMPVGRIVHSLADSELLLALEKQAPADRCASGQRWDWDQIQLSILHPEDFSDKEKRNAVSCVLRIEAHGHTMLLPSDIEARQESALVRRRQLGKY